ncbi:peptidase S1 [Rhodobacterales bacterium HKCCE2091]|nr:peptidase S1 [Rhodobacterales bacterium HKCCE2091]
MNFKVLLAAAALAGAGQFVTPDTAEACPQWQLSGRANLGVLGGGYLYSPRHWNVVAGGSTNLSYCGLGGFGYVVDQPDFEFQFQNDGNYGRLEISVNGYCDTVLLVNDAYGNWHFNDDHNGLNPQVDIWGPASGTYDVWVGTYGTGTCNATLELETWNH